MAARSTGSRAKPATKKSRAKVTIKKTAKKEPAAKTAAAKPVARKSAPKKPAPKKSVARKSAPKKPAASKSTRRPFFTAHNVHIADCGTPPAIDNTKGYTGYFENMYGEQSVFKYDPETKIGTVRMGDAGWPSVHRIVNGEWEGDGDFSN